jgi:hypothetical protein
MVSVSKLHVADEEFVSDGSPSSSVDGHGDRVSGGGGSRSGKSGAQEQVVLDASAAGFHQYHVELNAIGADETTRVVDEYGLESATGVERHGDAVVVMVISAGF